MRFNDIDIVSKVSSSEIFDEKPTFLIRKDVNSQTFVKNFISSIFFPRFLSFIFQNFFHFISSRVFVFQSEFFIPYGWTNFMLKHIVSLKLIVTDTWFATKKGNHTMPMATNTFYLFKFLNSIIANRNARTENRIRKVGCEITNSRCCGNLLFQLFQSKATDFCTLFGCEFNPFKPESGIKNWTEKHQISSLVLAFR